MTANDEIAPTETRRLLQTAAWTRGRGTAMQLWRAIKRKTREAVTPAVFLALTAYFAWNATQGDLGLKSYARQLATLEEAKSVEASARIEQASWKQRVDGLRDQALDADTIDERARAMLNLSDPTEIIVPYGQGRKLF